MQLEITPGLITSLSALVVALERNPTGGMYLVILTILTMMAISHRPK